MFFPERFTVSHEALIEGEFDRQGNPITGFAEPVNRKVVTVFPPRSDELIRAEQSGTIWHLDVIALNKWGGHGDRVTVNGVEYSVIGSPDDFTHHPWGFPGGYRLKLRRVNG